MKKVDNNLFLKRFSCLHMYVWANIERKSRKCILSRALTSINFLLIIMLFILLGASALACAQKSQKMFSLHKYSPRLELTLKGGNTRSMGRLGGIIPIAETNRGLLFANIFGLLDSRDAQEGNLGLGYRHLFDNHIAGGYIFYDHRRTQFGNKFNQITIGGEYLKENFESRINIYVPIGIKRKLVGKASAEIVHPNYSYVGARGVLQKDEQILHGFDVEVGGNLPGFKSLEGFVAYYHFNGPGVKTVHGVRLRSSLKLNEYISLEGEISHDRLRKAQTGKDVILFGGVKLQYVFGKKKENLTGVGKKMTQMVIRDVDAITDEVHKSSEEFYIRLGQLSKEHTTLGLTVGASKREIESAYRKLAVKHHTDKGGAGEAFVKIAAAKDILLRVLAGDIAGLIKAKEGAPNFQTNARVSLEQPKALMLYPENNIYSLSKEKTTKSQLSCQESRPGELVAQFYVATQRLETEQAAYTSNFFIVEQNVRKKIKGIIVQDSRHVWLVPQGLDELNNRRKGRENHYLFDIGTIKKKLICVNAYDVYGIPPDLPKKQLTMFAEQNKWEVRELRDINTGKIEYKVIALGPRLRGGGEDEIGTDKMSFRGIYDIGIYDQSSVPERERTPERLKEHLSMLKTRKIEQHFENKIRGMQEYKRILSSTGNDGVGEQIIQVTKGTVASVIGFFNAAAGSAVSGAADKLLGTDSSNQDGFKKLGEKVVQLQKNKHFLIQDLDDELISSVEQEYIIKKKNVFPEMQLVIEEMFVLCRNEDIELSKKIEFIRNALDLPMLHKKLSVGECIERLKRAPFFKLFDEELKKRLAMIVVKMCKDSEVENNDDMSLRTVAYFHGFTGSGKSTTAKGIAEVLGLPYHTVTIASDGQLSRDNVEGTRGWKDKVGWLVEALMEKNKRQERYTNGILAIEDFDKVLFLPGEERPNPASLNFLLRLLDTEMRKYYNHYFKTNIYIGRLSVFVTANKPLPEKTLRDLGQASDDSGQTVQRRRENETERFNPFAALTSRVDTVYFKGFTEQASQDLAHQYLGILIAKYKLQTNMSSQEERGRVVKATLARLYQTNSSIDVRDLKRQLDHIVLENIFQLSNDQHNIISTRTLINHPFALRGHVFANCLYNHIGGFSLVTSIVFSYLMYFYIL